MTDRSDLPNPLCECGADGCEASLPAEAWLVAGAGGYGKGPGGTDLCAVLRGHVRGHQRVVAEYEGWVAVVEPA